MEIDKRILNLSYSSLLTLHKCPRKFQLYRLNSKSESVETISESLTYAYGHTVGRGVQDIFEGKELSAILWQAYIGWTVDLAAENPKQSKSFYSALHAIRQLYYAVHEGGFLKDYDLVYYQDKPACELSFLIRLPDGFIYRGFVDAVIRNRITGKVVVLECKTTSSTVVNPAEYKNSAQAIGYSIVLDSIFPDLSSYEVYYLVYPTKKAEWTTIPFEKTYFQRALWIRELLLDVEVIKMYEQAEIYPMRGESCYDFYRECEYLQLCTLSTHHLVEPLTKERANEIDSELSVYQIQIGIEDLIEAQLTKNSTLEKDIAENADYLVDGDEML